MITTNISIYKDGKLEPFGYNVSGALDFSLKASELRIGNWVKENDTPLQISLNNDDFWHVDRFEPIPLTPEILEKAGWVWNEECKSFEKYPNGDVRMNLQYRDISGSYMMFNYVLKAIIAERIYYVHQLQNLYFALTGEELEINL